MEQKWNRGTEMPSPQTPPWLRLVDQSSTHSLSSQEHSYQVNMQWQNAPNASKCCTLASLPSLVFVKSSSWSVKRRKTNGSSQQFLVRAIWAWPSPPGYQRALLLFHEPWFRQLIFDEESLLHPIVLVGQYGSYNGWLQSLSPGVVQPSTYTKQPRFFLLNLSLNVQRIQPVSVFFLQNLAEFLNIRWSLSLWRCHALQSARRFAAANPSGDQAQRIILFAKKAKSNQST